MINYITESALCMAVLLGAYHLLLKNEKIYSFNRYYLLGAVVFSLLAPFIAIPVYIEAAAAPAGNVIPLQGQVTGVAAAQGGESYPVYAGGLLYGGITLLMFFRFARNIRSFGKKAAAAEVVPYKGAELVLLDGDVLPHTFLKRIFVSRTDYEANAIEEELYTHELAHVRQRHTLDILFIELAKTVFWFNPLLHLYKRAIQLNHEFLADEKVVHATNNPVFYQQLLLVKATAGPAPVLASSLNFSITKQRFIMMTKTTSQLRGAIKQIAIAPLMAGLMFLFCTETVAQEKPAKKQTTAQPVKKTNAYKDKEKVVKKPATAPQPKAATATKPKKDYSMKADKVVKSDELIMVGNITKDPEFPGGMSAFFSYVLDNYKLPEGIEGKQLKVVTQFEVMRDGTLGNIKILKDPGYGTGEEALRVLKNSPRWTPGEVDGKPANVEQVLPITLNFDSEKSKAKE